MAKKKNEIEKVESSAPLPAHLASLEGNTNGLENMRSTDLLLPRIILMQAMSPKVVDKEADSGDLFNSVTGELILPEGQSTLFIPAFHYLEWIRWGDRKLNEGMLDRSLDPNGVLAQSAARQEKRTNSEGKEVWVVTEYHNFVCVFPEIDPKVPIVISCAKTNHKKGKKLLSLARFRGSYPLYAGMYSLCSELTETDGNKYYTVAFENAGWTKDKDLFAIAKDLYEVAKEAFKSRRLVTDQSPEEEDFHEEEM